MTNNKHETSAVNVRVSYLKYELSALDAAVKPGNIGSSNVINTLIINYFGDIMYC